MSVLWRPIRSISVFSRYNRFARPIRCSLLQEQPVGAKSLDRDPYNSITSVQYAALYRLSRVRVISS